MGAVTDLLLYPTRLPMSLSRISCVLRMDTTSVAALWCSIPAKPGALMIF